MRSPFPPVSHARLDDGAEVVVVTRRDLPLVRLELAIAAGGASDGDAPGVSALAAELVGRGPLGAGASLAQELEELGGSLEISHGCDHVSWATSVKRELFPQALLALVQAAKIDRFQPAAVARAQALLAADTRARFAAVDSWAARWAGRRRVFRTPLGVHPYSACDALPEEITQLGVARLQRWLHEELRPERARLVVVGDVDAAEASRTAASSLRGDGSNPVPAPDFLPAVPADRLEVELVDHPRSPEGVLVLMSLGPDAGSPELAALAVALEGVSQRCAGEQAMLAGVTSEIERLAHGPALFWFLTRAAADDTAALGGALLACIERLRRTPPDEAELRAWQRAAAGQVERTLATHAGAAAYLRTQVLSQTGGASLSAFRDELLDTTPEAVDQAAHRWLLGDRMLLGVLGDAVRIAQPLSAIGKVTVLDPARRFTVKSTLPHDPLARLQSSPARSDEPAKDQE